MVGLKNEADLAAAQQRHTVLVQARDILPVQKDPAQVGVSRPASSPSSVLFPLPEGPMMATNSPR